MNKYEEYYRSELSTHLKETIDDLTTFNDKFLSEQMDIVDNISWRIEVMKELLNDISSAKYIDDYDEKPWKCPKCEGCMIKGEKHEE